MNTNNSITNKLLCCVKNFQTLENEINKLFFPLLIGLSVCVCVCVCVFVCVSVCVSARIITLTILFQYITLYKQTSPHYKTYSHPIITN